MIFIGSFITEVGVSDLDASDDENSYGTLTYAIQPTAGMFEIDSKTGIITLAAKLDYETQEDIISCFSDLLESQQFWLSWDRGLGYINPKALLL